MLLYIIYIYTNPYLFSIEGDTNDAVIYYIHTYIHTYIYIYINPYLFSVEGDANDAVIYNICIYKSLPV